MRLPCRFTCLPQISFSVIFRITLGPQVCLLRKAGEHISIGVVHKKATQAYHQIR